MEKQIIFNNKPIFYQVEGQGQTLVLLHGFMENMGMWDKHSEELSKTYQVICIDLPGHGKSSIYSENHGVMFQADIVATVLQAEQVDKCILIGHSMGGYITLAFAEKYPQKLNGFGLFHSHSMADTDVAKKNRERTIDLVKQDKMGFINQFIPSLFAAKNIDQLQKEINHQIELANQMEPKAIIAALNGMKERKMRLDVLAFSEVPVLFILGKHDTRISLDKALAQAATAPLAQVTILGNSGHMAWLEEPSKTISSIDGFIRFCQVN